MGKHEAHGAMTKRLNRVHGHLAKVIRMIEEERPCPAVAQQLQAVCSALSGAKRAFIQEHIEHCIDDGATTDAKAARDALREMKEISKYL